MGQVCVNEDQRRLPLLEVVKLKGEICMLGKMNLRVRNELSDRIALGHYHDSITHPTKLNDRNGSKNSVNPKNPNFGLFFNRTDALDSILFLRKTDWLIK